MHFINCNLIYNEMSERNTSVGARSVLKRLQKVEHQDSHTSLLEIDPDIA